MSISSLPFMPNDEEYGYYFYDINAKINHKFSDRSRIYLSVYNGKDHFAANYDGDTDSKDGSNNELGKYHCFRQMELYIQQPSVQQHNRLLQQLFIRRQLIQ